MKIKETLVLALTLLQFSQFAVAQQAEVIADAQVTKRVLNLKADINDVESSAVVVVTNIRLVDVNDAKKVSFFTASPTREAVNRETGKYILIENTSEYICAKLGYGKTLPDSRQKDDNIYLRQGEFIASSADGTNLDLVEAGQSWDHALKSVSCLKLK